MKQYIIAGLFACLVSQNFALHRIKREEQLERKPSPRELFRRKRTLSIYTPYTQMIQKKAQAPKRDEFFAKIQRETPRKSLCFTCLPYCIASCMIGFSAYLSYLTGQRNHKL